VEYFGTTFAYAARLAADPCGWTTVHMEPRSKILGAFCNDQRPSSPTTSRTADGRLFKLRLEVAHSTACLPTKFRMSATR